VELSRAAIFAESLGHRSLGATPDAWLSVTAATHPCLFEAMDAITHDGGGGCHAHYNVPAGWAEALPRMEAVMRRLTPEQLETVAIGECSEQEAIVREFEGLGVAHIFLNAFFEDFIERESVSQK
jgi:hypothetical protein